ncbi:uncharacterized protein LOC119679645 [Teleopsis dalmanni]|uniref:uncharacterized protein LOC119679415 n=1 Tax=Teleopsis dalmanni TaxID=139649 RepID=UPI0018CFB0A8|nr:uncharacterized protein LOC119679415 [Teleopsis dalmanni]XP_037948041.1 uncharacterized protein LOC119679645 [Teleopsis dalmanni]
MESPIDIGERANDAANFVSIMLRTTDDGIDGIFVTPFGTLVCVDQATNQQIIEIQGWLYDFKIFLEQEYVWPADTDISSYGSYCEVTFTALRAFIDYHIGKATGGID